MLPSSCLMNTFPSFVQVPSNLCCFINAVAVVTSFAFLLVSCSTTVMLVFFRHFLFLKIYNKHLSLHVYCVVIISDWVWLSHTDKGMNCHRLKEAFARTWDWTLCTSCSHPLGMGFDALTATPANNYTYYISDNRSCLNCIPCGLRPSVLGQDRSQTKKSRSWSWSWSCRSGVLLWNTVFLRSSS